MEVCLVIILLIVVLGLISVLFSMFLGIIKTIIESISKLFSRKKELYEKIDRPYKPIEESYNYYNNNHSDNHNGCGCQWHLCSICQKNYSDDT